MSGQPSPSASASASPDAGADAGTAVLQTVLAAEHAAVYVHGVLGARTSASAAPALYDAVRSAYVAHRDRRDQLVGAIAATGAVPVAAAVAYAVPSAPGLTLDTAEGITAAAGLVESGCTATYAEAVGRAEGDLRRQALGWLNETAVRELVLRGTPEMFPGADEQADR